jgi:hypothetical protein
MWKPTLGPYLTEFARKLPNLILGNINDIETEENEAFKSYITKWENDELEDGQ